MHGQSLGRESVSVHISACFGSSGSESKIRRKASIISECSVAKQLVHRLIEGRMTFPQVIERFQTLNTFKPENDQETVGRQVITYVSVELDDCPERAQALVTRLEAELNCLIGSYSPVTAESIP